MIGLFLTVTGRYAIITNQLHEADARRSLALGWRNAPGMALGGEDFMSVLHHPQSHFVTTNPRHLGDGIAIRLPQPG
jgi:hypothetical protein